MSDQDDPVARLNADVDYVRAELRALHDAAEDRNLTEDEQTRWDEGVAFLDEQDKLIARHQEVARFKAEERGRVSGHDDAPQFMQRVDPFDRDVRTLDRGELRDRALKVVETEHSGVTPISARQAAHAEQVLRTRDRNCDGALIARQMLISETDTYRSAFMKGVSGNADVMTDAERRAVAEWRAASEGTNSAGGFGVPTLLDPAIILTSGALDAPVLSVANIKTVTSDNWNGVSSAAASWSIDAEAAAVSDDMTTLSQPSITVYMARGFIPYSIEVGEDYPGFAAEMRALLDQGLTDHLAAQTVTGSGSAPQGIFTALDANTNVEVVVDTDGGFSVEDVRKVWKALPERWRGRAHWLMHTDVGNEIESFGTQGGSDYTVDLAAGNTMRVKNRPVLYTDYAPEFTGVTTAANILVVGDFSNYVVAQRAGLVIEPVQHLFDVTNNRPTGQRGWFARFRYGADSVNDLGFRLLQNQ